MKDCIPLYIAQHPTEVDITSGVDELTGNLPSVYVASDGTNLFVRFRLKGNPYDRKGGFLSAVWLVKLATTDGTPVATIGLDGKSPHEDYIYVANANGTDVQPIYASAYDTDVVPGTRITSAENGQYFLDFQVPIARVTQVASQITATTPVKLYFATSMAANLSVINKDVMDDTNPNPTAITNAEAIELGAVPPTISINGGNTATYNATTGYTLTGLTSAQTGTVTVSFNDQSGSSVTGTISNGQWSIAMPSAISGTSGTAVYTGTASVTSAGQSATSTQQVTIANNSTYTISIDGGPIASTNTATPTITGISGGAVSGGGKIQLYVDGTAVGSKVNINGSTGTWSTTLPTALSLGSHKIVAQYQRANGNTQYASASQILTYQTATPAPLPTVTISSLAGGSAMPTISGGSTNAVSTEVQIDGTTVAILPPLSDGTWSTTLEKPLSTGTHTIIAIATNAYGSSASVTTTYDVTQTSISIDNGSALITSDNTPTIRGRTNAPTSSTVSISIGTTTFTTNPLSDGTWSINVPLTTPLADGNYTVTASVSGASATQALTVKSQTTVAIASPADGSTVDTKQHTISGTAESGDTIVLNIENGAIVEAVTADNQGNWSYTVPSDWTVGTEQIVAAATDAVGNEAIAQSDFTASNSTSTSTTSTTGSVSGPVNAETPVISQPSGATYIQNETASPLSVYASVSDSGTLSYQWYEEKNSSTEDPANDTKVGGNSSSYTPGTSSVGTFDYYCVVTNTNSSVSGTQTATATSVAANITVTHASVPAGSSSQSSNSGGSSAQGTHSSMPPSTSSTVTGNVQDRNSGSNIAPIQATVTTYENGNTTVTAKDSSVLIVKNPDGTTSPFGNTPNVTIVSSGGAVLPIESDGTISFNSLPKGSNNKYNVYYDFGNDMKIVIGSIDVNVPQTGNISMVSTLIDPYGSITDPITGKPVPGVTLNLYYADTARNKANGKVPNTLVNLPIVQGFKPNNNQNPQVSDAQGAYGWLVFPTTDYYIVASKNGYYPYVSPTISVEQQIVKLDFHMATFKTPTIQLNGSAVVSVTEGQKYTDIGAKAKDGLGTDITKKVLVSGRVDTSKIGTYTLTYTVTDAYGKTATVKRTVRVTNGVYIVANYIDKVLGSVLATKLHATIVSADEISQLKGAKMVYILGRPWAVSLKTEQNIKALGIKSVYRIAGPEMYETSEFILGFLRVKKGTPIIIVPDGVPPSQLSQVVTRNEKNNYPILYVRGNSLDRNAIAAITSVDPSAIYIVGGTSKVSKTELAQLKRLSKHVE